MHTKSPAVSDHVLTAAIAWVIFAGVCVVAASAWAAQ
jgi:hypothetical protein